MNMYTLGRITKTYNKNVIVIAGINHINYIIDFLQQVGWQKDIESKKVSNKRVLIPNILNSGSDADVESITYKKKTRKRKYRKTKTKLIRPRSNIFRNQTKSLYTTHFSSSI